MKLNKREIGKKRNVLKRYQLYLDEFNKYDCRITPITVIHREYIFPKFGISRETLYKALNTAISSIQGVLSSSFKSAISSLEIFPSFRKITSSICF